MLGKKIKKKTSCVKHKSFRKLSFSGGLITKCLPCNFPTIHMPLCKYHIAFFAITLDITSRHMQNDTCFIMLLLL